MELKRGVIIRQSIGLKFPENELEFASFKCFKYPEAPPFDPNTIINKNVLKPGLYISTPIIEFRDDKKAYQLANELFEDFCNLIYYMVGPERDDCIVKTGEASNTNPEYGHFYAGKRSEYILIDNSLYGYSLKNNIKTLIDIADPHFSSASNGNKQLQDIFYHHLKRKQENTLKARIVKATSWVGKSISTQNAEESFLYATIALEILFSYDGKGIFQPSIGSVISEAVAVLVGHDVQSRIKTMTEMNKLYGIRSAIVHRGKTHISLGDRNKIILYAKICIGTLVTKDEYTSLTSIQELVKYFRELKMSFG
jgi:hypothetical protein